MIVWDKKVGQSQPYFMQNKKVSKIGDCRSYEKIGWPTFWEKLVEKWDYMVYNETRNSENVIPILRGIDT